MTAPAPQGRSRTRAALVSLLPDESVPAAVSLTELFGGHLDGYAEIILGPGRRPVGFMTRGEDARFSDLVRIAMSQLGLPDEAAAHHKQLATWFEHLRAFFKVEWHVQPDGAVEPLAACYFRRRPAVTDVVARLAAWGVPKAAQELTREVAATLEKDSIHFVSAAFRPGRGVRHKLYFSQRVSRTHRDLVTARLARVFALFGQQAQLGDWQKRHAWMLHLEDNTLFLSISFASDGGAPAFKIDYPNVGAARAALWHPADAQAQVIADASTACELAGSDDVTFLGVTYREGATQAALKYYCDVP